MHEIAAVYEREVRDLPCFEYRTTVVIEMYRVKCPDCGFEGGEGAAVAEQGNFSKRFEDAVGQACENAAARRVEKDGFNRTIGPSIACHPSVVGNNPC